MISALFEALFGIIRFIWNAPTWAVVLGIVILAILYFIGIFDNSGYSGGGGYGGGSGSEESTQPFRIDFDKPEHPFVFYDSHGNRCGRGVSFYDSKGERCNWGGGFHDGRGYYRLGARATTMHKAISDRGENVSMMHRAILCILKDESVY